MKALWKVLAVVAAVTVVAIVADESQAGPLGIFGGRGMGDCNVKSREEGPKQAKAENLTERPAEVVLATPRRGVAQAAPVQIAKTKSGVCLDALAKLNDAPVLADRTMVAKK